MVSLVILDKKAVKYRTVGTGYVPCDRGMVRIVLIPFLPMGSLDSVDKSHVAGKKIPVYQSDNAIDSIHSRNSVKCTSIVCHDVLSFPTEYPPMLCSRGY
jgi:hypothetical protein